MADTPVIGWQTQYGVAASAPTTKAIELLQFGLIAAVQKVRNNGMKGTRSQFKTGVRAGMSTVDGSIVMEPRPDELAVLLPFILGGSASGTSFPLAETIPSHVWDYNEVSDAIRFSDCYVNRATFRSQAGGPLTLTMEIIGKSFDETITFPSIGSSYTTQAPFMHHDLVLTVAGTTYKPQDFTLVVDNRLLAIVRNSQTRNHVIPADRLITTGMVFGNSADEQTLYQLAVTAESAIVATFTNGAVSLAFTIPYGMLQQRQTPGANGRNVEVTRNFMWEAKASAALDEMTTVLDSTP